MTDWIEEYESFPIVDKDKIKWNFTKDFQVQSNFIIKKLRFILHNLDTATDEELLKASQTCHNLISWTEQMRIMGFTGFQPYIDELLKNNFGEIDVIQNTRSRAIDKWLENNDGSQKIGENYYTIHLKCIYNKRLDGKWYLVNTNSVFNIMPTMEKVDDLALCQNLELRHQPSVYQRIFIEWSQGNYSASIAENHFDNFSGLSNPDKELRKALDKIKQIHDAPVSLNELQKFTNLGIEDLEYLIKHSYLMTRFVQERRQFNEHTIYLLRDCVMFNEIHETLDIIEQKHTSSDRLIVCRDLLSNKKRRGGHWYFSQEALFFAHEKYPDDFEKFYKEYSQILSDYENFSDEFRLFIKKLALYVDEHIPSGIDEDFKIDIVDLGFQGSINILLKYVIDTHCVAGKNHKTIIHMTVLAEWFKTTYRGMYSFETYSLLTSVESFARNELMYTYKLGSFEAGEVAVEMGSFDDQQKANLELLVTTMVVIISKKLGLA